MTIAVLIKQVPMGAVQVDPETHVLVRQSGESMVNPADLNAIEAALRLREENEGHVVVFTMGPPAAEKALRTALAMGCDEAVLISDRAFGGADTIASAKVLAAAMQRYGDFDLVLAGAQSSDGATGQVGPMVAQYMNVPHVSEAGEVTVAQGAAIISRRYGSKQVCLSAKLPALVTVSFGVNSPRLTTLRSQRAAKSKEILTYTNSELALDASTVGLAGSPTVAVDSYPPEKTRQAVLLTGSDAEVAQEIMALVAKVRGEN